MWARPGWLRTVRCSRRRRNRGHRVDRGYGGGNQVGGTAGAGGSLAQDAATDEASGAAGDGSGAVEAAGDDSPSDIATPACPVLPIPGDCSPPADIRFPYPKLSQTGCMNPTNPLNMADSVVPHEVNSPLWSDGALKSRGMKIPAGEKVHVKDCTKNADECKVGDPNNYPNFLPPYDDGKWVFPVGTVMVKSFMFRDTSLKSGVKLVETRLLIHCDDRTWVGYAYQWNEAQTEAIIVGDAVNDLRARATFNVTDAMGKKAVTWNYPSRADCLLCHTETTNDVGSPRVVTGGSVLGPETSQMNRMVLAANGVDKTNPSGS